MSQYQGGKQLWLHPLVSGHKGGIRISRFWNLKVEPDPSVGIKGGVEIEVVPPGVRI